MRCAPLGCPHAALNQLSHQAVDADWLRHHTLHRWVSGRCCCCQGGDVLLRASRVEGGLVRRCEVQQLMEGTQEGPASPSGCSRPLPALCIQTCHQPPPQGMPCTHACSTPRPPAHAGRGKGSRGRRRRGAPPRQRTAPPPARSSALPAPCAPPPPPAAPSPSCGQQRWQGAEARRGAGLVERGGLAGSSGRAAPRQCEGGSRGGFQQQGVRFWMSSQLQDVGGAQNGHGMALPAPPTASLVQLSKLEQRVVGLGFLRAMIHNHHPDRPFAAGAAAAAAAAAVAPQACTAAAGCAGPGVRGAGRWRRRRLGAAMPLGTNPRRALQQPLGWFAACASGGRRHSRTGCRPQHW